MKKTHKKFLLSALLATFAFSTLAFTACGDKGNDGSSSGDNSQSSSSSSSSAAEPAVLELSKKEAEIVLGDEMLLIAICEDSGAVTFTSSAPEIVSVSADGTLFAKDTGEAIITATYGEYTETCKVTVGLGDLQPVLVLKSYLGEDIIPFTAGVGYALNAVVSFNGKEYPCEPTVSVEGDTTIFYENGKVNATAEGTAVVTISTVWKGIDSALLTSQIYVRALKSVFITPFVTYAGESNAIATNDIELSIVDEWCGKNYVTSADVEFKAEIEGVESVLTDVSIVQGADLITYDEATGEISAIQNKRGVAVVEAKYESNGNVYARPLTVHVTCPIEEYEEYFEYDASKNFPVEIFGTGAAIREAYQGEKNVSPAKGRKQLQGVVANGSETEAIEVYTTFGAYRFTNIFAYTTKLTQKNFASTLSLAGRKTPISGYYYLSEDVTVDMTSQASGNTEVYFEGVFDGANHKVTATVGKAGVFGHLGGKASIRNTHFHFTFGTTGYVAGLAENAQISTMETKTAKDDSLRMYISLQNLYVTSTNYTETSYSLMAEMPYFLSMKDVYVNIDVGTETSGAGNDRGALFRMDRSLYNSLPAGEYREKAFNNVYVVTGKFIQMADYYIAKGTYSSYAFTTWAETDIDRIGATKVNARKMAPLKDRTNEEFWAKYGKYYTYDGHPNNPPYGLCMCFLYPHIMRYDTAEEVIASGITEIGSWTVA